MTRLLKDSRVDVVNLTDAAWQQALDQLASYSFCVTPRWSRILAEAGLGYQCSAIAFRFADHDVLLPIAATRRPRRLKTYVSLPLSYGGPLTIGGRSSESRTVDAEAISQYLRRDLRLAYLVCTPGFYPHPPLPHVSATRTTHILDLAVGMDLIWKGLDPNTRSRIRQAERAHVEVCVDNSKETFEGYRRMLQASAERWGKPAPNEPWSLFDAIVRHADSTSIRLWTGTVKGELAAGALCLYGKGEVLYWNGAMYRELARSRPSNLIHWRIIEDAVKRGYRVYDMGGSLHLEGLRRFKEGFGARSRDYHNYLIVGRLLGLERLAGRAKNLAGMLYRGVRYPRAGAAEAQGSSNRPSELGRPWTTDQLDLACLAMEQR